MLDIKNKNIYNLYYNIFKRYKKNEYYNESIIHVQEKNIIEICFIDNCKNNKINFVNVIRILFYKHDKIKLDIDMYYQYNDLLSYYYFLTFSLNSYNKIIYKINLIHNIINNFRLNKNDYNKIKNKNNIIFKKNDITNFLNNENVKIDFINILTDKIKDKILIPEKE